MRRYRVRNREKRFLSGQRQEFSVSQRASINRRLKAAKIREARKQRRRGQVQAMLDGYIHNQRRRGNRISFEGARRLLNV